MREVKARISKKDSNKVTCRSNKRLHGSTGLYSNPLHTIHQTLGNQAVQKLYRKVSSQTNCSQAAGHVIFRLTRSGIISGVTYFRGGAAVDIFNDSNITQTINIVPSYLVSSAHFSINPGGKVIFWVRHVKSVEGGSIVANPGPSQTVHDFVVCL
ncbi:MAG: hypothetical protein D6734_07705 [Candidatus Schekmanbacteria bacterium]|nr:MAG: hypothetical protein D6734_07705 [Candidatus Schekmanbacteria bacterium]